MNSIAPGALLNILEEPDHLQTHSRDVAS